MASECFVLDFPHETLGTPSTTPSHLTTERRVTAG
jgi:hypothetical protein